MLRRRMQDVEKVTLVISIRKTSVSVIAVMVYFFTRDNEVIMFSPCVFVCLYVCVFATMVVQTF